MDDSGQTVDGEPLQKLIQTFSSGELKSQETNRKNQKLFHKGQCRTLIYMYIEFETFCKVSKFFVDKRMEKR